jgi:DNA invertase Pin-like site-specific DNA recombinase
MGREWGYARISAKDQHEDRQIYALHEFGIQDKQIFTDKQSGKDFDRPMYQKLLKKLQPEDVIYVMSIDRLGRNYNEILEQWRYLTKERQVDIVILDMPLLDTRKGKDLTRTFLSDIVLQLLSFVAENERKTIRRRQREGIEAARKRGVRFGRPIKHLPDDFPKVWKDWKDKKITAAGAAEHYQISLSTFYYQAKKYAESLQN